MPIPNRSKDYKPPRVEWEKYPYQFKKFEEYASSSSDKNKITYALALFVAALTGYNVDLVLVIVRTLFGF